MVLHERRRFFLLRPGGHRKHCQCNTLRWKADLRTAQKRARSFSRSERKLYPARSKTWNLERAKAPGIDDRKSVHISNIDCSKSKFLAARGIPIASPDSSSTGAP